MKYAVLTAAALLAATPAWACAGRTYSASSDATIVMAQASGSAGTSSSNAEENNKTTPNSSKGGAGTGSGG